jgi:hypothetical protein
MPVSNNKPHFAIKAAHFAHDAKLDKQNFGQYTANVCNTSAFDRSPHDFRRLKK